MSGIIINPYIYAGESFSNTKSLAFDGVDDYVSLSSSLNLGTVSTISLWIKHAETGAISKTIIGENSYSFDYLFAVNYNLPTAYVRFGGGYVAWDATAIDDTDWHSVIIVRDTETTAKIYFDGVDQGSPDASGGTFNADTLFQYIGNNYPSNSQYFAGNIDEVAGWNSDKSASVSTIYNSGTPNDLTSLSPVAWYRMGDSSTFREPQILMPENTNIEKVSNYSMTFDGTDDWVNCGDSNDFSFGNGVTDSPFSVSFWLYINTHTTCGFVAKDYDASNREWTIGMFASQRIRFLLKNLGGSDQQSIDSSTSLLTGQWYNVVCTYDGVGGSNAADGLNIYLNNVIQTPTTVTKGTYSAMSNTIAPLTIGAYQTGASPLVVNGIIDETVIYNSELDASQVTAIYNSGTPTTITGAVAYWKLGEEAKFTDNWLVPNSELSNYSKFSFDFDGVDDYINCGDFTAYDNGDFSVSVWVYATTSSGTQSVFSNSGTGSKAGFEIQIDSNDKVRFQRRTRTLDASTGFDAMGLTLNNWHHIVGTHDEGLNEIKIYFDGVLKETETGSSSVNLASIDLTIGVSSLIYFFTGNIDELAIWDSVLSAGDVTAIYNSGEPTTITGAVSHWRMGENASFNTNWTVPDQVGSNDGTSANMTVGDLEGEAPNYSGSGVSNAMTIEDRVGTSPNSDNNAVSLNMAEADIEEEVP